MVREEYLGVKQLLVSLRREFPMTTIDLDKTIKG